ncbi:hypothetical protein C0995_013624 [Termitomyces sp. Mi166|nr:hypothetical protein C0995_013624 [Termitomyces sp. Mi166\
MRFTALFAAAFVAITGVAATHLTPSVNPVDPQGVRSIIYMRLYPSLTIIMKMICKLFGLLGLCPNNPPSTPPKGDGYTQTFYNHTGATEAADYLSYGLVDTVIECKAMCDSVSNCTFVNTYHDVTNAKGGSTQLTCSLFSLCHSSSDALNHGGQIQPDGSIGFITNSEGWCKKQKAD